VFLCSPSATRVRRPLRIPAYGRFKHEAAAVDPASRIAYLTEDEHDSCFYRFAPDAGSPVRGVLQALKVVGADRLDLASGHAVGDAWPVAWVDIATPDPPDPIVVPVRALGQAAGAAIVRRGEGLWIAGGAVYFSSTTGGPAGTRQIFRLDPADDRDTLTLIAQSASDAELGMPDNLTVSSWGDLYLAEDGPGENHLRILAADGSIADFARNALSDSELAGVCFSPDERLLFVNLQRDGLTLAISGPFAGLTLDRDGGGC